MRVVRQIQTLSVIVAVGLFSGCGYSFQGASSHWKAQGINRVFVRMLTNDTLHAGVEVTFTSALIKEFARNQRFRVVEDEKNADATIEGSVTSAEAIINSANGVTALSNNDPAAAILGDVNVATEYRATGSISVQLVRREPKSVVWTQSFYGEKIYQGNNRFGLSGTTSSLINASDQQLALNEVATQVASDAADTMLEGF
jgi:hypothetical protein